MHRVAGSRAVSFRLAAISPGELEVPVLRTGSKVCAGTQSGPLPCGTQALSAGNLSATV